MKYAYTYFGKKILLITFFLGKKELAIITHIEDLDEFYIQRFVEKQTLDKMMEELQPHLKQIEHKDVLIGM